MSSFLQLVIALWVVITIGLGLGYIIYFIKSTSPKSSILRIINHSNILNLFGKIFLNVLYLILCPAIFLLEWLIIAMTYHKN